MIRTHAMAYGQPWILPLPSEHKIVASWSGDVDDDNKSRYAQLVCIWRLHGTKCISSAWAAFAQKQTMNNIIRNITENKQFLPFLYVNVSWIWHHCETLCLCFPDSSVSEGLARENHSLHNQLFSTRYVGWVSTTRAVPLAKKPAKLVYVIAHISLQQSFM